MIFGACFEVFSFGVCDVGDFLMVLGVNKLNKNKKSIPEVICVYVCSTQPLVICIYSFKEKK